MRSKQPKLVGVQYMRAVASLMVLIGHVIAEAEHYMDVELSWGLIPWTRGVDIFFVISGFIILVSSQKYFETSGGTQRFLRNRFLRVVPLYWFFTTLMLGVLLVMPGAAKDTQLDWGQVVSSYLFIPYERMDGRTAPILSLGWTLNFEIFFYAVFALALLLPRRTGPLVVVAGMAIWSLIGTLAGFEVTVLRFWSSSLILEFSFGVLLGYVYVNHWSGHKGRNDIALAGMLAGFVLLVLFNLLDEPPRWLASGIPAAIMVGFMVFFWHQDNVADRASRLGLLLGDSSYSLYLSHRFVLRVLTLVMGGMFPATWLGGWMFVVMACAAAILGALFVYFLIEKPLLALFSARPVPQKQKA